MTGDAPKGGGTGGKPRRAAARSVGVAAVVAAIEQAAPADGVGIEMPWGFEMRATGLWRLKTSDKSEFRISGPFEVLAESRPQSSDQWGLLLRWSDRDGQPHEWIMPRRLLAGDAAEVRARLISCGLDVGTREDARRGLVEFLAAVRIPARLRTVQATGWYRGASGGAAFVLPDRTMGVIPGEAVRLDMDPLPTIYRHRGTLAGWRTDVAGRALGNSRAIFAVCCAVTAPLLALADDEGGGINLRGGSSTGKTTVVDVAASVWGAPGKTGASAFTRSWRQTDNALEETASAHNHTLLPLDEMGEADPAKLLGTLYMLAHGIGRTRRRPGGGNHPIVSWRTLVLSSGEESAARLVEQAHLRFKAGQEIRMLDVPAEVAGGFGVFEELHGAADGSAFQQELRNATLAQHGTAGPAFVGWLADRMAREPDFVALALKPNVMAWCATHVPAGADGQVRRAARRLGTLAVAGELATEAGITGWPAGVAGAALAVIFDDWLSERGGTGNHEDKQLAAAFRKFLGLHGAARFAVVREPGDDEDGAQVEPPLRDGDRTVSRAGWRWQEVGANGDRLWVHGVIPEVFDSEIAGPLGMEPRDARARLGRLGMIRGQREGDEMRWAFKPKRIPGIGRPRLIVAEIATFEA